MKRKSKNNFKLLVTSYGLLVSCFFIILLVTCESKDTSHNHDTYTCPMHPSVVADRPSTCPVCGMDLVRKARPGEEVKITEDLSKLIKSPNEIVVASIETVKGEYKSMPVTVRAQGIVTYDTKNIFTIPARVGGRLEKVFLKYAYQPVAKGQKIAEIYSPELITGQRELIFLLENDPENKVVIDAAKRKLSLLGLNTSQINTLIKKEEVSNTFGIYSPYDGFVITEQTVPSSNTSSQSSGGMVDGMGATAANTASASTSNASATAVIREGNYITAGETLFRIVNPQALRIELDLPASQATSIKKGDKLLLDLGEGNKENASVDFIQPFFNEGQDFVKVRVYSNRNNLHIGQLITAQITLPPQESLWVPKESVLDLGTEKIVFIKERGTLKPKAVTIGALSERSVEVVKGLASSDEIAKNAQYLIDSESFIKTAK
ncbi:efflux RND transporter periplasmic adaptor subunit [Chryseosolibacter indicus]|uniref:Efflux RND transporter periplasmic adaptor subunit n=1 Tax=Chryseosolibacter indicus TaxID=2782351 RepID=A0ABS5VJU5_9BACT|nr:efflux RND transporter periplasmic adaptor subunit [Chryseosolibacter indicus]MBT1701709.1 efflux RND transporter periplasmic adaptor subunit [Chryseosolibacter indicus]